VVTHSGSLTLKHRVALCLAVSTANHHPAIDGEREMGEPAERPLEHAALEDQGACLECANILIVDDRDIDAHGFEQLERIAAALGGVVAASLPAVDLGLAPVSR
jgi:electron transfer flavoprotein alpha subunit